MIIKILLLFKIIIHRNLVSYCRYVCYLERLLSHKLKVMKGNQIYLLRWNIILSQDTILRIHENGIMILRIISMIRTTHQLTFSFKTIDQKG